MKVQKAELAQKINKLKGIVPKKTTMPVLQGILVNDGYLIANNMETAVKTKLEGTEAERFIIPEKAFGLICNLPDGEVEISKGKNNTIEIKMENIKNKYQTLSAEDFPLNTDQDEEGPEISIKSSELLESIKRVSYAISESESNQIMHSLHLHASDGVLNFAGLDGHVVAWDRVNYEGDFELLIPKNTVDRLLSLGLIGNVSIRHSRLAANFITEDYEVYTRLVEGTYFNYQIMFKELPVHTVIDRGELLNAMVRAKMCTDGLSPVRFEMAGNKLNINIRDSNADYHETVLLQENLQKELVIGFDANLIIKTLKAFDCENIGLSLDGPKQPMILEAEDSDFRAMVLPVAIK